MSYSRETRRAEGDASCPSPATSRFHPTSIHAPIVFIHTVRIHSTFLPPATPHSERTYCVPAGSGQLRRATVQRGSQLHLSLLPHLAEEDDGTGGSRVRDDACTASSQALAAAGAASSRRRQRPRSPIAQPPLYLPPNLFCSYLSLSQDRDSRWEQEVGSQRG